MKHLLQICNCYFRNRYTKKLNMTQLKYYPNNAKSKYSVIQKLTVLLNHPDYAFRLAYQKIKFFVSIIIKKVFSKFFTWGTL